MTLSEVYFYMIIIIFLVLSYILIIFSEDLKEVKYYRRYFKITFFVGFLGIIMELFDWNFLCDYQCILITFSPFIVLNVLKGINIIFKKAFIKEPFHVYRKELFDGIWVKNNGDLENKEYYSWYTISLFSVPILLILIMFIIIKENLC